MLGKNVRQLKEELKLAHDDEGTRAALRELLKLRELRATLQQAVEQTPNDADLGAMVRQALRW